MPGTDTRASGGPGPGPQHDVIIVGASLAGCRTALSLAGRGVRVLLIDRAQFPRWKPCAGGLTLKTRPYIPEPLFDLVECTVQGAYLTFGAADVTHIRSETPLGWMIHRESFDHAHLELVRSCETVDVVLGVTVREIEEQTTGVLVSTDHETFQARVLVGADGAKSVVSRALPGHEDRLMGFAYEGEARAVEASLAEDTLFDFHTFPRGYGWVFPKGDHYSLGGFVCGEKLPGVKDLYRDFCSESGVLRGVETYRARGHPLSLGGSLRRLNSRRVVLAGEAGGLVDPLTGEGIYYALRSGHLAARHIAEFLEGHPRVGWVQYAGLPEHKDHRLAQKYMGGRASGILSFGVKGGREAGVRFYDALQLILRLVNIGDAKSCAAIPASTTHRQLNEAELRAAGVPPDMVRLSIGIEHVDDLIEDLDQALKASA